MPVNKSTSNVVYFNNTKKPGGMRRIILAAGHSWRALKWLATNEAAFRQELLLLAGALIVLAVWDISIQEKAFLLISTLFVLFAEIINTAIEVTIDRIGLELHPMSGLAKDLASAAVMVAIAMATVTWGVTLIGWI
ncbi:MAG: diacylglycerol kinase [Alteromonadaceae bacterium]|nr:diacylglycerol kinase [Alteromonadaceae bacterium]